MRRRLAALASIIACPIAVAPATATSAAGPGRAVLMVAAGSVALAHGWLTAAMTVRDAGRVRSGWFVVSLVLGRPAVTGLRGASPSPGCHRRACARSG